MFRRLMIALFASILIGLPNLSRAQDVSAADKSEFQHIISEQIAAFNADDGPRAYAQAAPMIKRLFPTPDVFMNMVRNGYAPVYRQKSFKFGEVTTEFHGQPTQRVTIVDVNGKLWTALYSFEKQPDGSWKINGCTLVETPGADV
jgi:hypothetical protein